MMTVERELDRVLTLLRNKIRERGFTQLEVQEALGWGRSYISQLLTKQKSLRVEQVLLILNVIGVDPSEFFGELYHFPSAGQHGAAAPSFSRYASSAPGHSGGIASGSESATGDEFSRTFHELRALLRGLLWLLTDKGILDADELSTAVSSSSNESSDFGPESS